MTVDTTTKEAISRFKDDNFATKLTGVQIIKAEKNYSLCRMTITPNHLNSEELIMGGAIFTLADFSFAVAANNSDTTTYTLSSNINFLENTKTDFLFAETILIKDGKICVYNTNITDDNKTLIAVVRFEGFRK